jgi:hypothetical protein
VHSLDRVATLRRELADLTLPDPFRIEDFCDVVSERRGKPMLLLPIPNPHEEGEPNGAWIETRDLDYVFYAEGTSPLHRNMIIGHELGHMWFEHPSDEINIEAFTEAFPLLASTAILRMMGRHAYTREQENDAELFGHVLLDQAGSRPDPPAPRPTLWTSRLWESLQQPRRS